MIILICIHTEKKRPRRLRQVNKIPAGFLENTKRSCQNIEACSIIELTGVKFLTVNNSPIGPTGTWFGSIYEVGEYIIHCMGMAGNIKTITKTQHTTQIQ